MSLTSHCNSIFFLLYFKGNHDRASAILHWVQLDQRSQRSLSIHQATDQRRSIINRTAIHQDRLPVRYAQIDRLFSSRPLFLSRQLAIYFNRKLPIFQDCLSFKLKTLWLLISLFVFYLWRTNTLKIKRCTSTILFHFHMSAYQINLIIFNLSGFSHHCKL